MNATATVESTALNAKKVRSERGVTKASEFIAACLASPLRASSGLRAAIEPHGVEKGQASAFACCPGAFVLEPKVASSVDLIAFRTYTARLAGFRLLG